MNASEIFDAASKSALLKDPYVEKVWNLIQDKSLYDKSPDYLVSLRKSLLRECLDFFSRHSDYYPQLFERLGISPRNAELEDLAKLAIPSDILRGDGHKQFLIKDVDQGGEHFMSSGTTGKEPVKIYRSPLDLAIMIIANTILFEHIYGDYLEPGKGIALFMAAPELRHRLNFVAFVHLTLENKRIPLLYGMKLVQSSQGGSVWQRLEPNKDSLIKFLKSKEEPKLFFTAPAGVYLMTQRFETMNLINKLIYKMATSAPPIKLGRGGVIVTGGGSKGYDLPKYDVIVEKARRYFTAKNKNGEDIPVPFMDVLGMTETLTALIAKFGSHGMIPTPLTEVFLLNPKTFEPLEEGANEGVLGIFNPFVTSWLECFYPGDIMQTSPWNGYYGRQYHYVRRLTVEEGWDLQRACGGTLEELMRRG